MHRILARFGVRSGADHRAVFHQFAERLGKLLVRPQGRARVRTIAT
jgi:hypothetical protein